MLAEVVVLPTPPFPDVATDDFGQCTNPLGLFGKKSAAPLFFFSDICLASGGERRGFRRLRSSRSYARTQWRDAKPKCRTNLANLKLVAGEPGLHGVAFQLLRYGFKHAEHAGHGDELGIELVAEHARGRFAPARRPSPARAAPP